MTRSRMSDVFIIGAWAGIACDEAWLHADTPWWGAVLLFVVGSFVSLGTWRGLTHLTEWRDRWLAALRDSYIRGDR